MAADLAEMGSLSPKTKNVEYVLYVIDVFTKYARVKPWKKGKTVLNAFIETVNDSNRKPNKLWVDQGREFYNKIMKEWLHNNDIFIYFTHNEGTSATAERFTKTEAKIYKTWQLVMANYILVSLNKLIDL